MSGIGDKILRLFSRWMYKGAQDFAARAEPELSRSLMVCGWTGSGSTLVCQMGDHLGLKVSKIHGYHVDNAHKVKLFMIRDPRDVISSNARRESKHIFEEKGIRAAMEVELDKFLRMAYHNSYYEALADPSTLIVKYEDFVKGKEEELIKFLASQFGVQLSEEKLKHILHETSIDRNIERASKIQSFEDYDKKSLIHGNHITNKGASGRWKEDMDGDFRKIVHGKIGKLIIDTGYEINDEWLKIKAEVN